MLVPEPFRDKFKDFFQEITALKMNHGGEPKLTFLNDKLKVEKKLFELSRSLSIIFDTWNNWIRQIDGQVCFTFV